MKTMKATMRIFCAVMIALMLSATAADAASIVVVKLLGTAQSQNRNGHYAGFYELKVNGVTMYGMCDDLNTAINVGDTWNADVYSYGDIAGGAGKFGPDLTAYQKAGYLFDKALTAGDATTEADIGEAIWALFASYTPTAGGQTHLTDANTNGSGFDFSTIMQVLTPNPLSTSQEFLISPMALQIVPIPGAVWLLGTALGLLGWIRRAGDRQVWPAFT